MNARDALGFAAALSAAALALAAPASAQGEDLNHDQAMSRLEACLSTGAPGAPRENLQSAVIALRALCYPQIKRVRALRLDAIDKRFGLPDARLTPEQQAEHARARDAATRQLNDEIVFAISNFTGLKS